MKRFLFLCSTFAVIGLASFDSIEAKQSEPQCVSCEALTEANPAVRCAKAWLQMLDGRDYRQAWIAASECLHERYSLSEWYNDLCQWSQERGKVLSRDFVQSDCCREVKGFGCGEYQVLHFETEFECYGKTCETLVIREECDCAGEPRWRVVDYTTR